MDIAKQFMGEIDHEMPGDVSDPDEETVMVDSTSAPSTVAPLKEILLERHWVFEEVLWIKGSSTNMSRTELQETVADAKGVELDRVMVCFFDEDELSHPVVTEKLGAAGPPTGDIVTVWCTKYPPAAFRRYSRKWVKIKKRMDSLPARWYLVTAIRKDALLDDERDQHLSAEEVIEKVPEKTAEELLEETRWLPPKFDYRKVKSLKEQYVTKKDGNAEEEEKKRRATLRATRKTKKKLERQIEEAKAEAIEGGKVKAIEEGKGEEGKGEEKAEAAAAESSSPDADVPDVSNLNVS